MRALVLGIAAAVMALTTVAGQAPGVPNASVAKTWTVPRTPDGHPDLQGTWSNATMTQLERAEGSSLAMTKEEVAKLEKGFAARIERLSEASDPNRPAPPKGGDGSTGAAGNVGGYNNFWIDAGDRVAIVNGEYRRSLLVHPPNGRVPGQTPEARERAQQRLAVMKGRGQYDHPEFRPLAERCLMSFGSNAGPPMLPNYFYNNNYQIVQTKDHVMILVEMVHDVRVVRMANDSSISSGSGRAESRPERLPKHMRPWMGDSIGRWEGDTLVVETTNFHPLQQFRGASENLRVTERFQRTSPDTILYKFTIEDPTTFTAPWSGEVPYNRTDELIYEYACHEGNYALSNVLSGERDRERRETERKKTQQ